MPAALAAAAAVSGLSLLCGSFVEWLAGWLELNPSYFLPLAAIMSVWRQRSRESRPQEDGESNDALPTARSRHASPRHARLHKAAAARVAAHSSTQKQPPAQAVMKRQQLRRQQQPNSPDGTAGTNHCSSNNRAVKEKEVQPCSLLELFASDSTEGTPSSGNASEDNGPALRKGAHNDHDDDDEDDDNNESLSFKSEDVSIRYVCTKLFPFHFFIVLFY